MPDLPSSADGSPLSCGACATSAGLKVAPLQSNCLSGPWLDQQGVKEGDPIEFAGFAFPVMGNGATRLTGRPKRLHGRFPAARTVMLWLGVPCPDLGALDGDRVDAVATPCLPRD